MKMQCCCYLSVRKDRGKVDVSQRDEVVEKSSGEARRFFVSLEMALTFVLPQHIIYV